MERTEEAKVYKTLGRQRYDDAVVRKRVAFTGPVKELPTLILKCCNVWKIN